MEKGQKKAESKNQLPPFEPFHARSFVFTNEPIPETFKFPLFDVYVRPIHHESNPDPLYIEERIVPHFEEVVNTLSPVINETLEVLNKIRGSIKSLNSKKVPKCAMNFLNADIWRKYQVLYPLYLEAKKDLLNARYSALSKRAELLSQINNLAYHLAEHPRYYYIELIHAMQPWKPIELDYIPNECIKHQALKTAIYAINQQLLFISNPFRNTEKNVVFFDRIIHEAVVTADVLTGIIPENESTNMFSIFMDSKMSPISFSTKETPRISKFPFYLKEMTDVLTAYGNFEPGSNESNAISSLCKRYLFAKYLFIESDSVSYAKEEKQLWDLSSTPMRDIIAPYALSGEEESLGMPPKEFFKSNKILSSAAEDLASIVFDVDPFDIGAKVFKLSLTLILVLSKSTGKQMEDLKTSDELSKMWKALIIATEMPGILTAFKQFEKWSNVIKMPSDLSTSASLPINIINKLL